MNFGESPPTIALVLIYVQGCVYYGRAIMFKVTISRNWYHPTPTYTVGICGKILVGNVRIAEIHITEQIRLDTNHDRFQRKCPT
jgi:hypothetical protein